MGGDGSTRNRIKTPEADKPIPLDGEAIARSMFGASEKDQVNGSDLFIENDVHRSVKRDMYIFLDQNKNGVWDEGEQKTHEFRLYIFISRDYTYLEEAFEKTSPAPDEICVYLEDNDGDLFTDGGSWIRVGANVRQSKEQLEKIIRSGYFESATGMASQLSEADVDSLMSDGYVEKYNRKIVLELLSWMQYLNFPVLWVFNKLAEGVRWFTDSLRSVIKFSDTDWDPAAQRKEEDGEFEPFFFPYSNLLLETIFEEREANTSKAVQLLQEGISEKGRALVQAVASYGDLKIDLPGFLPELSLASVNKWSASILSFAMDRITEGVQMIQDMTEPLFDALLYLNKKILSAINAYFCGLWNALVEAVLGFLDMIAYLFIFAYKANQFFMEGNKNMTLLHERMDELWQAAWQFDYLSLGAEMLETLKKINWDALTGFVSIEKIAYLLGAFVGFIVEMLVGLIFSGGTASLASLLKSMGNAGTKLMTKITASLTMLTSKQLLKAGARKVASNIMEILRIVTDFLRQGPARVAAFFRSMMSELTAAVKAGADKLRMIKKALKLTDADIAALEKTGLSFIENIDDAYRACKVIW